MGRQKGHEQPVVAALQRPEEVVAARLDAQVGRATDHSGFDETVPAGLHEARASRGLGGPGDHRRALQVKNDQRTRETPLDQQGGELFGADDCSTGIDQRGPIAVAIQRDAKIGPAGHDAPREFRQVGVCGRIGIASGRIWIDGRGAGG